jgi:ribosome production factor 2
MFIRGHKSSQIVTQALKDLTALKKPDVVKYNDKKKNKLPNPFESETNIEFLSNKSDCSLFMYGSHSKKRSHNLVIGRLFNYHILDMVEFGISQFKSFQEFRMQKNAIGSKPCFVISGPEFDNNDSLRNIANLIVDFFRGTVVDNINIAGIDHVIALSAKGSSAIYFRHYSITLKKSGTKIPRVELDEIGPSLELAIRRSRFADTELRKRTLPPKPKGKKRIVQNELKELISNVFVPKQNIDDIDKKVKRPKALKRRRDEGGEGEGGEGLENDKDIPSPKKRKKSSAPVAENVDI